MKDLKQILRYQTYSSLHQTITIWTEILISNWLHTSTIQRLKLFRNYQCIESICWNKDTGNNWAVFYEWSHLCVTIIYNPKTETYEKLPVYWYWYISCLHLKGALASRLSDYKWFAKGRLCLYRVRSSKADVEEMTVLCKELQSHTDCDIPWCARAY